MHIFPPFNTKEQSINLPEEKSQSKLWWNSPESREGPALRWAHALWGAHCPLLPASACLPFSEA